MHVKKINKKACFLTIVCSSFLWASTLEIYQDGAKYRYVPIENFVGFTQRISAECDGQDMGLLDLDECSENQRLCKSRKKYRDLENEIDSVLFESKTLDKLISISKPNSVDAGKWIDAANKIGKQKAQLHLKQKQLAGKLDSAKKLFAKQAPSSKASFTLQKCAGELELTLPAGQIGARLLYEADVSADDKIQVKQYLAVRNRSGVDIVAKDLYVYAKSHRVYLRPQRFDPWIAREVVLRKRKALRESRALAKAAYADVNTNEESLVGGDVMPVEPALSMGSVVQTGYKNYHISGVELPSTGEEIKVKIADYQAATECEYVSYPYIDNRIYRACSFSPISAIESNKWRIQKDKRLVSDQAYGEYRDGKYLLNVDIDDEVLAERRHIVKKDRSSGIFGGSIKKKDGFVIELTNISDKPKRIRIVDRIPTSSTDKIKVKLLKIEGAQTHKLLKDGKLDMTLSLAPNEHKMIKVMFELSYSKDTKVAY